MSNLKKDIPVKNITAQDAEEQNLIKVCPDCLDDFMADAAYLTDDELADHIDESFDLAMALMDLKEYAQQKNITVRRIVNDYRAGRLVLTVEGKVLKVDDGEVVSLSKEQIQ